MKENDKSAFEYLYDWYSEAIYGVIWKIVRNDFIAEEILQDAFLKYWTKSTDYQASKGRLFTWMLNIARNLAIDTIRSKEFKQSAKSNTLSEYVDGFDRQYQVSQDSDHSDVQQHVANLSEDQRKIIELMYFKGYSQTEIANEFNIPLGTIKTRAKAAMVKLKELFS